VHDILAPRYGLLNRSWIQQIRFYQLKLSELIPESLPQGSYLDLVLGIPHRPSDFKPTIFQEGVADIRPEVTGNPSDEYLLLSALH
jgi:hypothetical protein